MGGWGGSATMAKAGPSVSTPRMRRRSSPGPGVRLGTSATIRVSLHDVAAAGSPRTVIRSSAPCSAPKPDPVMTSSSPGRPVEITAPTCAAPAGAGAVGVAGVVGASGAQGSPSRPARASPNTTRMPVPGRSITSARRITWFAVTTCSP